MEFYEVTDEVWRYNNQQWEQYDNLVRPRYNHHTALIGANIFHIGGFGDDVDYFRFGTNFCETDKVLTFLRIFF